MDETIEDGVGDRRLTEGLVLVGDRELAGDDRGAQGVAILDQLERVGRLRRRERPQREVIEDEYVELGPGRHEPRQAAVGAGQDELVEQARDAQVVGAVASVRFTVDPVDLFPLETVDLAEVHLLAGADLAGMSLTAQWTARSRDATGVLSGTVRIPVDP